MPTSSAAPAPLPGDVSFEVLLRGVLDVSLTGIQLLRPVYDPASAALVDFTFAYTNPVGLRMIGQAQQPSGSMLALFPHARESGILSFYQRAFAAGGEQLVYEANYQADGIDNYLRFQAQRTGELLLISFSDTSEQPRTAVEVALRESQASEQAARAQAEAERQRFYDVLMQLPAQVAVNRGPDHVFELVNGPYQQMFPSRRVQGLPIHQALPELAGQQFFELLDQVYQTGEPFYRREMAAWVDFTNSGRLDQCFVDVFFQPLRDAQGRVDGILNFSYDVTEQVLARQQVQTLNEELAASNEELRANNEDHQLVNLVLVETQHQLRQLNQDLEARVQERTQELAEQQALLRQILELMPAYAATMRGPEHRYGFANSAYQQLVDGRARPGQPVAEAIPEAVEQNLIQALDDVYTSGQALCIPEGAIELTQADGTRRQHYIHTTYLPLPGAHGQPADILAFGVDITEQVLARREREAQQHLASVVFEQAPVGIFVVRGLDYIFEVVNEPMVELLGYPRPQLLGRPALEAVPELAQQGFRELLHQVWDSGQAATFTQVPAQPINREPGYFNFVYQPLRNAQGQVHSIACVVTEVTAQVLATRQVESLNEALATTNGELTVMNQELMSANTQLTRTNAELDSFVYTASHDLKAPIANIEGLLNALREELPAPTLADPAIAPLLDLMQGGVARFQQTIGHLVSITYLQREAASEQLDLEALVESVRLDLAPSLTAANGQLQVNLDDCSSARLAAKDGRSILFNLLSNALKYRAPERPPFVQLRARCLSDQLVLEVQDNGLGLSQEQQNKLFGLFRRLHGHVEGSGVGLYSIKKIIENAGGTISVASELGVGSTFTVVLPR